MLAPERIVALADEQKFDSKFERDVFDILSGRGYHVRTQVCVGDPTNHRYRIDLVVEGMQGRLAVECDGDEWHGPDRYEQDMARQRDLERAGWQFVRIRGGDFYRDREQAMEPVWMELERLGISPGGIDDSAAPPPEPAKVAVMPLAADLSGTTDEPIDEVDIAEPQPIPTETKTIEVEPPTTATRVMADHVEELQNTSSQRTLFETEESDEPIQTLGEKVLADAGGARSSQLNKDTHSPTASDDDVKIATRPSPYAEYDGTRCEDPRTGTKAAIAKDLANIVNAEGPMFARRAYDIYRQSCGIDRMDRSLKRKMNSAMQLAITEGLVLKEDELDRGGLMHCIMRSRGTPPIQFRERGPRSIDEIPPSELLVVASITELTERFPRASDEHLRAILRFYDLLRLTANARQTIEKCLTLRLQSVDDFVRELLE